MLLSDLSGALLRRWYVVVLGLLATAGLCFGAMSVVPVSYQARALVVLLPPRTLADIGGNPYLALGGLESVVGVLSRSMMGDDMVEDVAEVSSSAQFDVFPDASTSGPVLLIAVQDVSPDAALEVVDLLVHAAPEKLSSLQQSSGAPANSFISMSLVTRDEEAVPEQKKQIRAVVVAAAAGLAATAFSAALLDTLLLKRGRRSRHSPERAEGGQITEERIPEPAEDRASGPEADYREPEPTAPAPAVDQGPTDARDDLPPPVERDALARG